ncbi:MAG: lytic murein transglycosylase [Pseudomonadota bacterium]
MMFRRGRKFAGITAALAVLLLFPPMALAESGRFDGLRKRLAEAGFNAGDVEKLFASPEVRFDLSSATGYFKHNEYKLDYGQFSNPESIAKARAYLEAHRQDLENAHKAFGVDPATVVAVLLVETRLGTFVGKRPIFSTLATLASLSEAANAEALYQEAKKEGATRKEVDAWIGKRSGWAFGQLTALLKFAREHGHDPAALPGSYAGAMGFCQFMPDSALAYAADGNGDGRIDLFTHPDAIHSVARYLARHGWKKGLDEDGMRKVLLTYNRSNPYVDALLAIRRALNREEK